MQISRYSFITIFAFFSFFAEIFINSPSVLAQGLELRLLHANDTHAYMSGLDKRGNPEYEVAKSSGGTVRMATVIKQEKKTHDNVIALHAGDVLQGTLFYSLFGWKPFAEEFKYVPWDAMTLGNHEFDDGCEDLLEFMKEIPFPVLAANLTPKKNCPLSKAPFVPYIIINVRNTPVGIIGIANPDVIFSARACQDTIFVSTEEALKQRVAELENKGVKHIIALTHIGFSEDKQLARHIDGIDIIVGGHSHTYLDKDSPAGSYPTIEYSPNGSPVLIVTTKASAEYIGSLNVRFDEKGVAEKWSGEALALSDKIQPDPEIVSVIKKYRIKIDDYKNKIIGENNNNYPDGKNFCRKQECLSGMILADAILDKFKSYGADAAMINSGGVRNSLPIGDISFGDCVTIFPFDDYIVLLSVTGEDLLKALENSVSGENAEGTHLLQVAGLRYFFDSKSKVGQRIVRVEFIDETGKITPLDLQKKYKIATLDYLFEGGDEYTMLKDKKQLPCPSVLYRDVFIDYIKTHSPLALPKLCRINRISK